MMLLLPAVIAGGRRRAGGGGASRLVPSFVAAASTYVESKTSFTANAPAGYAAGQILLGVFTSDLAGDTLSFPSGWTQVRTDSITNGDSQTVSWGWTVATGSDSFAFATSGGYNSSVSIAAYADCDTTAPIEDSSADDPDNSSPPGSPVTVTALGLTTANADRIVWAGAIDTNGQNGLWTPPSGMTLRTQTQDAYNGGYFASSAIADLAQAAAGATGDQAGTWTQSGAAGNPVAYLIALKGALAS
jgi:hypothetical protein